MPHPWWFSPAVGVGWVPTGMIPQPRSPSRGHRWGVSFSGLLDWIVGTASSVREQREIRFVRVAGLGRSIMCACVRGSRVLRAVAGRGL